MPGRRPKGKTFEVRAFSSVAASIKSYLHNLNTHHGYEQLRDIRYRIRTSNKPLLGTALASGLSMYSIRRNDYTNEIKQIIATNHLQQYDKLYKK